jgi:hypothetical protein
MQGMFIQSENDRAKAIASLTVTSLDIDLLISLADLSHKKAHQSSVVTTRVK